jgi:DNA (cytosine-5)-methyltransferase 1
MLNGLDLFSGIGGISVALRGYVETIAYCEADRYAQAVLLSRMRDNELDRAPICTDVRELQREHFGNIRIDIIFGGFPCQDISIAGNGKGLAGERSGLFFDIIRLVKEIKPSFVFLENVPAIRTRGLFHVISSFTEIGYDCRWTCLSAASIGAPHKRERWFLLAHADKSELWDKSGRSSRKNGNGSNEPRDNGQKKSLARANGTRLEGQREEPVRVKSQQHDTRNDSWWETEPAVGRVVDGLPMRMDRIRCLGNSVVPAQVKEAFERLMGLNVRS